MTNKISFCPKSKYKSRSHYGKIQILGISLREKCSYSESFWSFISRIRIEYGKILRISPYFVRMRENTDQKNSEYGQFSCSVFMLKIWILKTHFRLSSLMPPKEIILLFPKLMFCYNFRSVCVCLHYDDKDIHKPSCLTFGTLHTKKTKLYKINCHLWFMADDIENQSFLTFETLNVVPSSFFLPKIGYWWKYLEWASTRKVKSDGY